MHRSASAWYCAGVPSGHVSRAFPCDFFRMICTGRRPAQGRSLMYICSADRKRFETLKYTTLVVLFMSGEPNT